MLLDCRRPQSLIILAGSGNVALSLNRAGSTCSTSAGNILGKLSASFASLSCGLRVGRSFSLTVVHGSMPCLGDILDDIWEGNVHPGMGRTVSVLDKSDIPTE